MILISRKYSRILLSTGGVTTLCNSPTLPQKDTSSLVLSLSLSLSVRLQQLWMWLAAGRGVTAATFLRRVTQVNGNNLRKTSSPFKSRQHSGLWTLKEGPCFHLFEICWTSFTYFYFRQEQTCPQMSVSPWKTHDVPKRPVFSATEGVLR